MAPSTFSDLDCSIARTLEIVGSRWTLLVLRDLFAGITREAGAEGPPMLFRHEQCGQVTHAVAACSECGEPLDRGNIVPVTPPGSRSEPAAV